MLPSPLAPVTPTPASPIITEHVLAALLAWVGEPDLLFEIIPVFQAHAPTLVAALREALVTKKIPDVRRAAHSLKGSLCSFGVPHLTEAAQALELCDDTSLSAQGPSHLQRLETDLPVLSATLDEILEGIAYQVQNASDIAQSTGWRLSPGTNFNEGNGLRNRLPV
jgi:HPt (histidine-containing phosphotransfer) domain-containing protein